MYDFIEHPLNILVSTDAIWIQLKIVVNKYVSHKPLYIKKPTYAGEKCNEWRMKITVFKAVQQCRRVGNWYKKCTCVVFNAGVK